MTLIQKLMDLGYEEKKAKALIMAGSVLVNEIPETMSMSKLKDTDIVRIKESKTWVSRGAFKLIEGLQAFQVDAKNKIAMDVGSSTGGFTQVLIENGATKVFAIDSGTNQLDYLLRKNEKVISLEKTNLKSITPELISGSKIDLVVCDVSFISVKNLFDVLATQDVLSPDNDLIILIKPQFEAPSKLVEEKGWVDKKHHNEIINNIIDYAKSKKFNCLGVVESPIKGNKSKNIEYLAHFKKE